MTAVPTITVTHGLSIATRTVFSISWPIFPPPDAGASLLLGDYLYAHGLVRVARGGNVDAARFAGLLAASRPVAAAR